MAPFQIALNSWSIRDYDSELSTLTVNSTLLTSGNWTAQNGLRTTFEAMIGYMGGGHIEKLQFGNLILKTGGNTPLSRHQNELRWLIRYHGNTSLTRHVITIPCARTELLDPAHRQHALMTDVGVSMFIASFQNFCLSPRGEAVTVDSIELVGRRV